MSRPRVPYGGLTPRLTDQPADWLSVVMWLRLRFTFLRFINLRRTIFSFYRHTLILMLHTATRQRYTGSARCSRESLYRPSDRRLSEKWLPTCADRGCHVVSVTDPYGRILGFLDRSRKRRQKGNTVSNETVMHSYWSSVTWPVSDCTVSYRPVLSSERAPYRKKKKLILIKKRSGHGPQRGARYPTSYKVRTINSV
jgi:hypothetical protein